MKKSTARLQVVPEKGAPYDENLRLWLERYLEETGLSTTEFASLCGGSRTLYDDYLKRTYFGVADPKSGNVRTTKNSKLEPMLRAYRARVEGPNAAQKTDFVKTTGWHQLRTAIETAIDENSITLVTAVYGNGKTTCVHEFMFKKLKRPFVLILCSPNVTVRYFLQKIARQLFGKNKPLPYTIPELEDLIVEHLTNHPRVIVIDQANYLPAKALGSITYIWEASRAPVTLVGTPTLRQNFQALGMSSDESGQLASRVAAEYVLTGLDLGTVKGICQRVLGEKTATAPLVKRIWESIGGKIDKDDNDLMCANFRALEFRLRRLKKLMQLNQGQSISDEMLQKCELMMLHKAA